MYPDSSDPDGAYEDEGPAMEVYDPAAGRPFYAYLEVDERFEWRAFYPIRAGRYLVSIQASERAASDPQAAVPIEDVNAWEVAVFTDGSDGEEPRSISPRAHPHLFRDARWRDRWVLPRDADAQEHPLWTGQFIPTAVVKDLLDCLCDPEGYAQLLAQGLVPGA